MGLRRLTVERSWGRCRRGGDLSSVESQWRLDAFTGSTGLQLSDECGYLWIGRCLQLLAQQRLVHARVLNRSRRVSARGERAHQADRHARAEGVLGGEPAQPGHGAREIPVRLERGRRLLHGLRVATGQARALVVHPAAELRRGVGDVEPLEQRTPIQLERFGGLSSVERGVEGDRVARHDLPVEPYLVIAAAEDRIGAERAPQKVDGLAEGVAGVLLVMLRPEEGEQLVAPVQAAWGCEDEVCEERDPARLGERGAKLVAGRTLQLQRAESP